MNTHGRLELDPELQNIEVKAVRNALNAARYWYDYFGFKTERGFVFMFDLVSLHGGSWLNAPRFKGAGRALLRKMLADKKTRLGRPTLTEQETMEVIANMIANASSAERHANTPPRASELMYETSGGRPSSPPSAVAEPPGQTILDTGFALGSESPAIVQTGIYVPEFYKARPEVDLIVYFHGHKIPSGLSTRGTISEYWKRPRPFLLREAVNDSGKNVVLVAPTLGIYSQAGKLTSPNSFDMYVDGILQVLAKSGPYAGGNFMPVVGNIVLACHSGGGKVMRRLVQMTHRYSNKIRECWGFDCLYDSCDAAVWRQWALGNSNLKLFVYYRGSTRDYSEDLRGNEGPKIPRPANVTVEGSSAPSHGQVPTRHLPALIQQATFLSSKWSTPVR